MEDAVTDSLPSETKVWANEPTTADELRVIAEMLDTAKAQGLLTVVVWSFGNAVSGCVSISQACQEALREWDI